MHTADWHMHYGVQKYYQSTSKAHAKVLHNLMVTWCRQLCPKPLKGGQVGRTEGHAQESMGAGWQQDSCIALIVAGAAKAVHRDLAKQARIMFKQRHEILECVPTSGDMRGESLPGMPEGASDSQSLGECQRTKSARQPPGLAALNAAMSDARTSPCSRIRALWPASESPARQTSSPTIGESHVRILCWGRGAPFWPLQPGALLTAGG